jgi:hypothetical protein
MLTPLSELFPGYSPDDPQTGGELYQTEDYQSLSDMARDLRRHLVDAVHGAERRPITSPVAVKKMLEQSHLHGMYRKWVTFVLDENRERVLVPTSSGNRIWAKKTSNKVPHPEMLARQHLLPDGGTYLVLYKGSVNILAVKDHHGGSVAEDIAFLFESLPVADVLFWDSPPKKVPTLYSVVVGAGDCGGDRVEFPDPAALAIARRHFEPATATVAGGE